MSDGICFDSPFGSLNLQRRPRRPNEVLQAWDAADHYLLNHLAEQPPAAGSRLLVVNDSFGALCSALAGYECSHWSDSVSAQLACRENAQLNQCREPSFVASTESPAGSYERILYRLPRSHSLMRYQLQRLLPLIDRPESFVAAAMAKYINRSTVALLSEILGEAQVSLAWKKARLLTLEGLNRHSPNLDDWETTDDAQLGLTLGNHANVFSRGKLDRGSRALIEALPGLEPDASTQNEPLRIADLGCGNGLLGIVAARQWPRAEITFFDESHLAVASAERNAVANLVSRQRCHFYRDDCMSNYDGPEFDLILCNPPFHQEQHIGDHIARQMFAHSWRHLTPGGKLCVVGNRHLGYHIMLKKRFGNCATRNADAKFVVLLAEKPTQPRSR